MNRINRRTILKAAAPFVATLSKAAPEGHGTVIGHGAMRYRVDKLWAQADPATHPVNDCHEMVQTADGRLFLFTNHKQNNVLVFDTKGKLLASWTLGFGGAHGLSLHRETDGGADFKLGFVRVEFRGLPEGGLRVLRAFQREVGLGQIGVKPGMPGLLPDGLFDQVDRGCGLARLQRDYAGQMERVRMTRLFCKCLFIK